MRLTCRRRCCGIVLGRSAAIALSSPSAWVAAWADSTWRPGVWTKSLAESPNLRPRSGRALPVATEANSRTASGSRLPDQSGGSRRARAGIILPSSLRTREYVIRLERGDEKHVGQKQRRYG